MPETISQLFAFDFASKIPSTLHFLLLGPASAGLDSHLEARGTASAVTSLRTIMSPAAEQLATRVPAGGRGLSALQFVAALAAGTRPLQGQGAGGAGPGVTDNLAGVMLTGEQTAAFLATLEHRTGALPRLLGFTALA